MPRPPGAAGECVGCVELARALAVALEAGDRSRASDCRVLIRRHPEHGCVPDDDSQGVPER
ncbi:hypothetical protein ACH4OW_28120 [Streptomyces sp. NPDC017056]|uniref:hypothetical protein n=1 Tax=Streptomyces sp. NPDC017056 TaxID=3364973 RepID=UPI0037A67AEA